MRFLPFAVACLLACVWLNQGRSLADTDALAAEIAANPEAHALDRARFPLLFLYRRSNDEELYFNVANAIRGVPYDRVMMTGQRAAGPESFRRMPETDGRWHRPYVEVPLEYPAVMLPFVILPDLLAGESFDRFAKLFGLLMSACLLAAAAFAIRAQPWRASPLRARQAWWMIAALFLAQGGLAIQRLDAVPALFLAIALWAAAKRRPATLGVAMGLAIAAKFVPALLLPPLLCADRATWRSPRALGRLVAGLAASCALGLAPMLFPPDALAEVLRYHAQRGLHVESTYGTLLGLYRLACGTATPSTLSFGSYNLDGAAADTLAKLALPLMAVGVGAVALHAWRAPAPADDRARADRLVSTLLATLAVLWLTAKVFSPQYMTWAIALAPALSGRRGCLAFALLAASMAVTQLYLRGYYDFVADQRALGVLTLVLRLATLGALLVVAWRAGDDGTRTVARGEVPA